MSFEVRRNTRLVLWRMAVICRNLSTTPRSFTSEIQMYILLNLITIGTLEACRAAGYTFVCYRTAHSVSTNTLTTFFKHTVTVTYSTFSSLFCTKALLAVLPTAPTAIFHQRLSVYARQTIIVVNSVTCEAL